MLSVPVRRTVQEWDRLYDQWLCTNPSPDIRTWLKKTYNVVNYDWDQEQQYRLWFRDSESAVLFRLKHG
jgi:hypothetical protein